jgi:uncharacterized protein YkwD
MWTRLSGGILVAVLLGSAAPTAPADAAGCWRFKGAELSFARRLNHARAANGVPKLHLDRQLSRVARRHTWEMQSRRKLFHTPLPTLGKRVTRWRILGENIGWGSSVRSLHRAFMRSPAHRTNMLLSRYRHVGLGVRRDNGRMWVTVVFEAASNPGTRLPMPSC